VIHRAEEVGGEMPLLTAVQAINNSVTGRTNRSL
jgi:hypothetical protein